MGEDEEETNTSLGGYEQKRMAKNRDYRLPAFSLDKRMKGLKEGGHQKSKKFGKS
jgi:hypothetical protein